MTISFLRKEGMTLIEILLVVSLVSVLSIALYHAVVNGLKVWEASRRVVTEEDIAIFFEKLTHDLNRMYFYSQIPLEGSETRFAFPTVIRTSAEESMGLSEGEYIDQLGKVEYAFELTDRNLYRRQANYSQALDLQYAAPQLLVSSIKGLKFRYFYYTQDGEVYSEDALDGIPSGIEVTVEFSDNKGQRVMQKFIDVPLGS